VSVDQASARGGVKRFIGLVRFNTKAFTVSDVESAKGMFR